jgi:hypothetical protein
MELISLGTFVGKPNSSKPDFAGNTPYGRRVVVGIREGRIEGARLKASQRGDSAADWLLIGPDGTASPEVRMALRTDDGAFIYMEYSGRGDASAGLDKGSMYTAITFEVEDERYAWLNKSLFVGKGGIDLDAGVVRYDVYELR